MRTFLTGGGRTWRITAPKTSRVGRFDAKQATMRALADAAREKRRVSFVIHYADGKSRALGDKGGYRASDAYNRAMANWEDPFVWLGDEADAVAHRMNSPETTEPIIGVDVTIFGEPDPGQGIPKGVDAGQWETLGADDEDAEEENETVPVQRR